MRPNRTALAFSAATLCLLLPSTAGAKFSPFFHYWGDVVVATDTTPAGREITQPTPDHPVYYIGVSLGCKLGSTPGDKLPDEKKMNQFVAKVLEKQGYIYATPGKHDPTLFLVLQWGTLDPLLGDSRNLLWFLGYNPDNDIAAPTAINMLGMEVFRRNARSREIETILDDAGDSIYGIIVTAFEYKSASTPKPIAYWQTRISLPTVGKSMAAALPTMITAAGPSIGVPTNSPLLRDADDLKTGHVSLGDVEILGTSEAPAKKPDAGK